MQGAGIPFEGAGVIPQNAGAEGNPAIRIPAQRLLLSTL